MTAMRRLTVDQGPRLYTITTALRRFRFYPASWPLGMRAWTFETICTPEDAYRLIGTFSYLGLEGARVTSRPTEDSL